MKRFGRAAVAGGLLLLLPPAAAIARGQSAQVAVEEENFRAQPRGTILAELYQGTPLRLGETRGQWREATLEAWIWGRSVQTGDAGELDLVVNAGGENLRVTPNGQRLGRALGGMRLERVEARGDWLRVRRSGWIWTPSLQVDEAAPAGTPSFERAGELATAGVGAILLDGPAGDTMALLRQAASLEVVGREGGWSRVRIEGWISTGALADPDTAAADILGGISRDSLQAYPDVYRGRLVEWRVQFIALREAERFRTDFFEGEPFILARGPGDDVGFVYVAVPPELLSDVQRVSPLDRIRILARVRSVRSPLTDAPVLELLEIRGR